MMCARSPVGFALQCRICYFRQYPCRGIPLAGGRRGLGTNEERDQTLNQLLTELDGFEGRPGVLLLAATNRPEVCTCVTEFLQDHCPFPFPWSPAGMRTDA